MNEVIYNIETGLETIREYTSTEIEAANKAANDLIIEQQKDAQKKAEVRAIFEKLGLNANEVKTLLNE